MAYTIQQHLDEPILVLCLRDPFSFACDLPSLIAHIKHTREQSCDNLFVIGDVTMVDFDLADVWSNLHNIPIRPTTSPTVRPVVVGNQLGLLSLIGQVARLTLIEEGIPVFSDQAAALYYARRQLGLFTPELD
ncbi:MAG: hypothetical protein GYB68_00860 [Chloroflexi bacterium]|nr:hypothetical protein [Chloroflexota bacterium]